jgi:hypothetical protein
MGGPVTAAASLLDTSGESTITRGSSDKYRTARYRAAENNAVSVRPVSRRNWKEDLETSRQVFNESFKEEWEFHPHSSEGIHEFFDPINPVLDTRQMLIGEVEGRPAGWCLGLAD